MNLPASFIESTRALLGNEEYEKLAAALQEEPPISIRLNRWKIGDEKLKTGNGELTTDIKKLTPVSWSTEGFYLSERLTFTFDPLFHAGCYYVQEASSMFVEQALRQYVTQPVVMLDLCAAPGGKSTHARSVLPEGSLLVANELIRNRSQILAENLTKWGHPDVVVTNNDPSDFSALTSFFDVILTDVPCSGEGMFRKDPVAIEEWSPENVEICWQRQRRIIADIWPSLKPGGMLIYSTCTYNIKEDEENVRWIQQEFGAELLALDVKDDWNITGDLLAKTTELTDGIARTSDLTNGIGTVKTTELAGTTAKNLPVYHFLPHKTKGEGFFLAVLRKPEAEPGDADAETFYAAVGVAKNKEKSKLKSSKKKEKRGGISSSSNSNSVSKENLALAKSWLIAEGGEENWAISSVGTFIHAFPQAYSDELAALTQHLRIISAGIAVGEVKGKDLIPNHALAMCPFLLRPGAFATEEVSYELAIAYLRKEAITLSATAPLGYILLTYRNVPLGFVKNIGNRANNLYPQEWRIRSGFMPEEIKTI